MTTSEDILNKAGQIPPLPGTVIRLISVLNDPGSTVNDIVEVIQYDQSVTSQMLRMCNSAYFGLARQVTSINDALRYLGTVKVLQLVMAVHANSLLSKPQEGYGLDAGILWRHSVAVALAASTTSQRISLSNTSLAFTAGLLHDIGKVVLNQYVGKEFSRIVEILDEQKCSFVEAEKQVLGFSHEEIGGKLAELWQLPPAIANSIRYHHTPNEMQPADPLVDVVYLGNCVCLLLGIGLGADELRYRADPTVTARYDLHESDLEVIGAQTMTELKRVEQLFADSKPVGAEQPLATR